VTVSIEVDKLAARRASGRGRATEVETPDDDETALLADRDHHGGGVDDGSSPTGLYTGFDSGGGGELAD